MNDPKFSFPGNHDIIQRHVLGTVLKDSFQHHPVLKCIVIAYDLADGFLDIADFHLCKIAKGSHIDSQNRHIPLPQKPCHFDQASVSADNDGAFYILRYGFFYDILLFILLA